MTSSSQFRSDGPNALTSNQYAKDFNEVKALGGNGTPGGTPSARTLEQTHNAMFWQSAGGPALLWNDVARDLVEDPGYGVDIDDSALLFAMLNLSGADAAINCWNDKYHFDFWRPWQAIREAAGDGNRKTEPDTSWTALITAPYPDHASGHLCLDGAHLHRAAVVLRQGQDRVRRHKQPVRWRDALLRPVLGTSQGDHRGSHLGGSALPHRRCAGGGPRQERRRVHGGELLPAAQLTRKRLGDVLSNSLARVQDRCAPQRG